MNKEFVPYNESLELKELGFDEPCFGYYDNASKLYYNTNGQPVEKDWVWVGNQILPTDMILAPTFSQAFRWFREKLAIRSCIIDDHQTPGYTYTTGPDQYYYDTGSENGWFHTYEEAELACLNKLIEIVKQK